MMMIRKNQLCLVGSFVLTFAIVGCTNDNTMNDVNPPDAAMEQDASSEQDSQANPDPEDGGTEGGTHPEESSLDIVMAYLDPQILTHAVTTLASDEYDGRKPGTPGGEKTRTFLIKELEQCGIQPLNPDGYEQMITNSPGANLLGLIKGTDTSVADRYVLISAHFDHLGNCNGLICNGAYDNAAAVANVLSVACAIQKAPLRKNVIVALWDQEEPPAFLTPVMGSQFFVDHPPIPLDKIDAAIVLDLAGSYLWPDHAVQFAMGSEKSPQVEAALRDATPEGLDVYIAGIHLPEVQPFGHQPWSDYHAFRNAEIPFLFLSNGQNQHYHTYSDDMGIILPDKLLLEAEHLLSITYRLAQSSETPTFDSDREQYHNDLAQAIRLLEQALGPSDLVKSLDLAPGLGTQVRTKLEGDLVVLQAIQDAVGEEETLTKSQVSSIRNAVQRIMCLCGNSYSAGMCLML